MLIVAAALAIVMLVAGCNADKEGAAERIEIETTHVYLAPTGEASTYQLKPKVYPEETAKQDVHYSLKDSADRRYLLVGTDGLLTARGELKQDEEGNVQDIIVIVTSNQSSDVFVEIVVTIEEVAVEQIIFSESVIVVELHGDDVQLQPQFKPAHASIGRNVEYSSDNTSIATVSSSGLVTPRGIGKVAIWVRTPRQGAFDSQVETHVTIDVRYSELNYRLELITDESALKQIWGRAEALQFNLIQLDSISDPEPSITWYVNTTPIDDGSSKDNKILNYTPSTLPPGEYVIRAELSNSTQRQVLESDKLIIYSPLESLSLDAVGTGEDYDYLVGDSIRFLVTYTDGQYPPEQYRWTITHTATDSDVTETETFNKAPAVQTGGIDVVSDLTYIFEETGTYSFTAEAMVKSMASGVVSRTITITVGEGSTENDVYGVTVEGTESGLAEVFWDPLPYECVYTVEINVNGAIVSMNSESHAEYFGRNSAIIPTDVATFAESFSVRVKSSVFNNWTDWTEYTAGHITQSHYGYFKELVPGLNAYVSDLEELAEIVNYVSFFRPESLTQDGEWYTLDLFVPFTYAELDDEAYPFSDELLNPDSIASYNDAQRNAYHLMVAATYSYAESVNMGVKVLNADGVGRITYSVSFLSEISPAGMYSPDDTTGRYPDVDKSFTHYSETGRGENGILPIEELTYTLGVATSNQLYYAVINGYRPLPASGTVAERIYNVAKSALNAIIDDSMTDAEKALAIYDWLAVNVSYDNLVADNASVENIGSYNAFYLEGVFIDGVAVCDGIAKAFSLLCGMEGIHTYKIMGVSRAVSPAVGHTWNAVVIDGYFYYVDATWANLEITVGNDNYEAVDYEYFLMSLSETEARRVIYGEYPPTPAESNRYAYETATGEDTDFYIAADDELGAAFGYVKEVAGGNGVWISLAVDNDYLTSIGGTAVLGDKVRAQATASGASAASIHIARGTLTKLIIRLTY